MPFEAGRSPEGFDAVMQLEERGAFAGPWYDLLYYASEMTLFSLLSCLTDLSKEINESQQNKIATEESIPDEEVTIGNKVIIEIKDSHHSSQDLSTEDLLEIIQELIETVTDILTSKNLIRSFPTAKTYRPDLLDYVLDIESEESDQYSEETDSSSNIGLYF